MQPMPRAGRPIGKRRRRYKRTHCLKHIGGSEFELAYQRYREKDRHIALL
jgi:hypothetical protein